MKKIIISIFLFTVFKFSFGQSSEKLFPRTLIHNSDTFGVRFSYYPKIIPVAVIPGDTTDLGTDGAKDLTATIYFGKDSLIIPYSNMPYEEVIYFPIKSPSGSTIYRLHFNGIVRARF